MEPEEFVNPNNRVYKYDQILTTDDLQYFYDLLIHEYKSVPPIFFLEKEKMLVAINTISTLMDWIGKGKNDQATFNI